MNDFDLPARRELPDEVRDSIRLRVREGMDAPRRRSWRGPALAAAAVAVLAAGALVATGDFRAPDDVAPATVLPSGVPSDSALADEALDRCWAALGAAGKADGFPDRDTWKPVYNTKPHGFAPFQVTVLSRAEGKPLVCDTTATTVTVSDPDTPPQYAPGTSAAVLLATPGGLIAGVTGGPGMLRLTYPRGSAAVGLEPVDGLFVYQMAVRPSSGTLTFDDRELTLPEPALSVVDRPAPGVDRTSDRGRLLGDCLAGAYHPTLDPESFQPGASLVQGPTTVVVGSFGQRFVFCAQAPEEILSNDVVLHEPTAVREARGFTNGINFEPESVGQEVVGGFVPPETARMEVRRANGKPALTPVVTGGTFVTVLPEDFEIDVQFGRQRENVTIALYDARDQLILEQPALFPAKG
ncbi:hypothetical protein [Amycolatopsis magusensis]|uniref:Uncharacterized protein n=1 Tax=Amycolatopsis magusensis TaxID=882444 RepID=A0ABS4PXB0_9PSEU|nr:hypothetical protein [Amycolatopsis magusensis]MBP2184066.1 hypothetical protein [Amycolatopsis magusensis]